MPELFEAKVLVVPPGGTGLIADVSPEQFRTPDIEKIAQITNQFVIQMQSNIFSRTQEEERGGLALSELELTFGIDFEAEAGAEIKIPLIGPAMRGGVRGGATFEVHIKFSRDK
jgi:hypothetical protein